MAKLLAVVVSILLVANANSQADGDINADGVCSGYRVNVKGTYMVWWYGDLEAGTIQINASVDNKGWIAVGISNDKMMVNDFSFNVIIELYRWTLMLLSAQ